MTSSTRTLQPADGSGLELAAVVGALSARFAVGAGDRELVRRARLDTFDRRLQAAGLTLELLGADSGERLVLGRLDGTSTTAVPVADLRWPAQANVLPGPVRDAVASVTGIRALMVAPDEKRWLRTLELNVDGKTVARVELDEPASSAGRPARLMVHAVGDDDEQARQAADLLLALGLRGVEHGDGAESQAAPATDGIGREAPAVVVLSSALTEFLVTMRENLPGLLDDVDTEFLHDFRVAVRRTRATLKLGRPFLPDTMGSRWEQEFKWLGDLTTPVRDLDVYQLDLPRMASWLVAANPQDLDPFEAHLRSRRAAERRALVRGLRSARFGRLLTDWKDELARLRNTPETPEGPEAPDREDAGRERLSAGRMADLSISRAFGRVARGGATITGDSPAEELHTLRKRCKELRYALEVCAAVVAKGPRKEAVADLKILQDVLGRFQDSEVQHQALRSFAEEMTAGGAPPAAALAMGELIGHLEAEQARARSEFEGAFAHLVRPSSMQLIHRLGGGSGGAAPGEALVAGGPK